MSGQHSQVPAQFRPNAIVSRYDELNAVLTGTLDWRKLSDEARSESRCQAFLAAFAAIEGVLREDAHERLGSTKNDPLASRLQMLATRARNRFADISITDLLDAWRLRSTQFAHQIGLLKQYVEYRNWLAHGRCITPPQSGLTMDPHRVVDKFRQVGALIPDWPAP